jgi:cytidine deaminase
MDARASDYAAPSSGHVLGHDEVERLIAAARAAREHAYAPYSGFRVGAAVLAEGAIYSGSNVENASYGLTICAERVAVFAAVAAGQRRVEAVAVVGDPSSPTAPCGACRQVLHEFGPTMTVVMAAEGEVIVRPLRDLLPLAFGSADLANS